MRDPIAWRLGDPVPFNMFAMLDAFEGAFRSLRSGDALPAAFQWSASCSIARSGGTCRLRDALVRRLGSSCRETPHAAVWCAPHNWQVVLAKDVVSIISTAAAA